MSLKQRIEEMKLPGHNGPALRGRFQTSHVAVALLLKKLDHVSTMPIRRNAARVQAEQYNVDFENYYE
jgi:hypothetical protein